MRYKIIFILAAVTIVGCGDKKEEKEPINISEQQSQQSTTSSGTEINSEGEVAEITLTADDQMRFSKNEIRVKPGQTVRLTFKHVGQMQKKVMGHNFVLLKKGTDINEFGQQAVSAANNDYIPQDSKKVIAHTKMLGGGETTTIEFEAPEPGSYDFICSFPGHYAIMRGKLMVE